MSTSKLLMAAAVLLIPIVTFFNWPSKKEKLVAPIVQTVEIEMGENVALVAEPEVSAPAPSLLKPISDDKELPVDVDLMLLLFQPYPPNLPFVETIAFSGRVEWVSGRAAYLGDYSSHFQTSKHFISRSLHGVGNYLSDIVSKGDRFNVYRKDKQIEFHLVLDLSRLKLWLYSYDKQDQTNILLKTYRVSAGRIDNSRPSGCLTPLGTFAIGNDFAVYAEGVKGNFKNEQREMITVYGMRWISLGKEIAGCSGSSKGLGLHGVPWKRDEANHLQEAHDFIGRYESSGSISLLTEDIEELYSVIVSKPAIIHIVRDFTEAKVPGNTIVF